MNSELFAYLENNDTSAFPKFGKNRFPHGGMFFGLFPEFPVQRAGFRPTFALGVGFPARCKFNFAKLESLTCLLPRLLL